MRGSAVTQRVARVAAGQHGNITFGQLVECGLSPKQIERRVLTGWLVRRHHGTFALGHVPRARDSRWSAAVLALGDEAFLSHAAAGVLWGVLRWRAVQTHVTIPPHSGRNSRDGIVVHRQLVPVEHRAKRHGIPCTNLVRTLLDLAAVLPLKTLESAFEEAQVIHHLPPEVLAAEVLSRWGYRGSGKLKVILDGAVDPAGVRSILELRFLRMCAAHGIPRPLVNEKIEVWRPDFLWPAPMVVVETDGVAFHRTPAKRRRDEEKDAFLRALGFTVIRLRWADVVERPAVTAARVREALSDSSTPDTGGELSVSAG